MGRLEDLYSEGNPLYNGSVKRPGSRRLDHFIRMLGNHALEKLVKSSPRPTGDSMPEGIYNSLRNGLVQSFNAKRHTHGQKAFKNNIPGLKKIIQNFYSFYHLNDGLTTMQAVYTMEVDGGELLLHIERDGKATSIPDLELAANEYRKAGGERAHHNSLVSSVKQRNYGDMNTRNAGVYKELTDGDIADRKVIDPERLSGQYHEAELRFFGKKGTKTIGGHTQALRNAAGQIVKPSGKIFRYGKPSKADFLKFYGEMDLLYSAVGLTAGPAEKILTAQAAQDVFTSEVGGTINRTFRRYGGSSVPYLQ